MPDVLRINSNVSLNTAMERRVLRSLGQGVGDQGITVDGLRDSKSWRKAAEALVKRGLAEEVRGITMMKAFRITETGRRALRAERGGAEEQA